MRFLPAIDDAMEQEEGPGPPDKPDSIIRWLGGGILLENFEHLMDENELELLMCEEERSTDRLRAVSPECLAKEHSTVTPTSDIPTPRSERLPSDLKNSVGTDISFLNGRGFYFCESMIAWLDAWRIKIEEAGGIVFARGSTRTSCETALNLAHFVVCDRRVGWEYEKVMTTSHLQIGMRIYCLD